MNTLFLILSFVVAITFHEAAHAWMSDRLGDPTAKLKGRLSLNPLRHLDLYGTFLIPLFLIVVGSPFVFGWAKPVEFDPFNLKDPKKDTALISLAGPIVNLILAVVASIFLRLFDSPFSAVYLFRYLFLYLISTNIALAVFNLIPIHPLDGGKILVGLLPKSDAYEADRFLNRYGLILLFLLIFPVFGGVSALNLIILPILKFLMGILVPGTSLI